MELYIIEVVEKSLVASKNLNIDAFCGRQIFSGFAGERMGKG